MRRRVAVIDTNVVVAGLLTRDAGSPTARVLDGMLRGTFPFAVSIALLAEYRTVLLRDRVRARHRLTPSEVDVVLGALVAEAIVREPAPSATGSPDAGDQHLWDLLAGIPGSVLVTGDAALLRSPPTGSSVLSPLAWTQQLPA